MKGQYRKPHMRRTALLAAAAYMCVLMSGCGQVEEEETMSELIPVQVQSPEAGTLTLKNEFVGTISPEESVYVISMVSAEVLSTNVNIGDEVTAGDVLCQLDSEAAELQLASAQAQYNSAAAGVNAAEVGYEIAQSQYDSTVAQLDAQMGGQKNLQMYQLQIQVENIEAGIDNINEQKSDLDKQKSDTQKQADQLKKALSQAQKGYEAARDIVTLFESYDGDKEELAHQYFGEDVSYNDALKKVKEELAIAEVALSEVKATYDKTYPQLQSGISAIDDGQDQLDDALSDAYRGLEQAQAVMNMTEEQVYKETQAIVDANKQTAALGVDSAAAGVNSAKVGIEGAQIAIDSAEYQLDMYTLKAPISGVIEAVNVKEHDFATPSTPAYIISNKDTMTVTFYVSEGIRNTLKVGQQVSVDRNGKLFDAAITEIGSMIDQTMGLFAIKACVSAPDESLLTGCSVKITADTYSQGDVLLIPYDAVYYDDSQPYVYVAVGDVVERRDIETGIFDEQTMTVMSGLTVEDRLITSWSANLREGARISIQTAQDSVADGTAGSED